MPRKTFSTKMDADILKALMLVAVKRNRSPNAVLEEAVERYLAEQGVKVELTMGTRCACCDGSEAGVAIFAETIPPIEASMEVDHSNILGFLTATRYPLLRRSGS